jgi:hypothetical protein
MYSTIGTFFSFWMTVCCPDWIPIQPGQQTVTQLCRDAQSTKHKIYSLTLGFIGTVSCIVTAYTRPKL